MDVQYNSLGEEYASKPGTYYTNQRQEMTRFLPDGISSILEIGCGSGMFGAYIKGLRPNCQVWGIEPNPEAAAVARRRLDHVVCVSFDRGIVDLVGKKFDCIIFNDVLEHLVNPEQALLDCKQFLTEGGSVIASIPNILFYYQIAYVLIKQDWRYQESGILDYTHLRFFTKKSIVRMFKSCGFEIDAIEGINQDTGPRCWLFVLLTLGLLKDWTYTQFGVRAILR
jgi:2-polyprenyl-3-methyl-5-hydroxy-6-metoxy-1,4-benzoquinol methylase